MSKTDLKQMEVYKKNNSNYGGGDYQKEKAALKSQTTEKVKLPLWLKITLGVLFGVLLAALILRMTVYKESLFMNYLTSLLLGLACAALFYKKLIVYGFFRYWYWCRCFSISDF